jgi:uncharacterized iron-regulated protein
MSMRTIGCLLVIVCLAAAGACYGAGPEADEERCEIWLDLYSGEPVTYEEMVDDLAEVRVIYLGERHTLVRHHTYQEQIISDLLERGCDLAVGLEMLPAEFQPVLDRYNEGTIGFEEMAGELAWEDHWSNYEQYRQAIEIAARAGAPILALNAHQDVVRKVATTGIAGLDTAFSRRLPEVIDTDQPAYRRELLRVMMVMAHVTGESDMMQRMFEAQVVRDETMAQAIAAFLQSGPGRGRTAVVLCGGGHVSYGYGIPSRIRARIPDITDRIVIFSESGDVVLSEREKAMSRAIEVTHSQLRENRTPYADYLLARALAKTVTQPPDSADVDEGMESNPQAPEVNDRGRTQ